MGFDEEQKEFYHLAAQLSRCWKSWRSRWNSFKTGKINRLRIFNS